MRLFCFPSSGGAAQSFRNWQRHFGDAVEVCPVQLPGRWTRRHEPLLRSMAELVAAAGTALLPLFDRPFGFFGHSVGAIAGFELTRWLRRHRHPMPSQLLIAARCAPSEPDLLPQLHQLPDRAFIDQMQARYEGIPQAILDEPEMLALLLPILRADIEISETYQYRDEAPLDVPMHVYGGITDRAVTTEQLAAWQAHSTRTITHRMFPGGHFFVVEHEAELIGDIRAHLDAV